MKRNPHVFCRELPKDPVTGKIISPPEFIDWIVANMERNRFEPEILDYKATRVIEAFAGDKTLLYMPVQMCPVLDSAAINPEASKREIAAALKQITQTVAWEARRQGQGEILFMCSDPATAEFATHHGYELLETPFCRMKLK